jgi:hypothetical protein
MIEKLAPGANPTIASYNTMGSLACFENKNIFLHCKNALAYYKAGVVAVNSKVEGLAPLSVYVHNCDNLLPTTLKKP